MTKDEAWEMIDSALDHSYSEKDVMKIKEALAQPAQEPVAWMDALKDAFFEGFTSVETYNDTWLNSAEEAWAKYTPPVTQPAQEIDWKDLYEKKKRESEMWVAKYEKDIRPLEKAVPVAQPALVQEPVAWMRPSEEGYDSAFRDHSTVAACTGNPWTGWVPLYTAPPAAQPEQENNNFCPRCGKRLEGVLGRPQIHTCTPPLWGHK